MTNVNDLIEASYIDAEMRKSFDGFDPLEKSSWKTVTRGGERFYANGPHAGKKVGTVRGKGVKKEAESKSGASVDKLKELAGAAHRIDVDFDPNANWRSQAVVSFFGTGYSQSFGNRENAYRFAEKARMWKVEADSKRNQPVSVASSVYDKLTEATDFLHDGNGDGVQVTVGGKNYHVYDYSTRDGVRIGQQGDIVDPKSIEENTVVVPMHQIEHVHVMDERNDRAIETWTPIAN